MAAPLPPNAAVTRPVRRWTRRWVAALTVWALLLLLLNLWVIHGGGASHG